MACLDADDDHEPEENLDKLLDVLNKFDPHNNEWDRRLLQDWDNETFKKQKDAFESSDSEEDRQNFNEEMKALRIANAEKAEQTAQLKEFTLQQVCEEFDRLDVNGDGEVDGNELFELARKKGDVSGKSVAQFMKTFDTDGDGVVSRQEWIDYFAKMFDEDQEGKD